MKYVESRNMFPSTLIRYILYDHIIYTGDNIDECTMLTQSFEIVTVEGKDPFDT